MTKQLLTPLRLIARMNFYLKNYSCELLNLTKTVGKVELISTFKPAGGLHIVVRVAEHACDDASKRILKPSTHRLKIFLVKYQNLGPLEKFRDQTISVQLKIHVREYVLAILTTYMETSSYNSCLQKLECE